MISISFCKPAPDLEQRGRMVESRARTRPGHGVILPPNLNIFTERAIAPNLSSEGIAGHLIRKRPERYGVLVVSPFQAAWRFKRGAAWEGDCFERAARQGLDPQLCEFGDGHVYQFGHLLQSPQW